MVSTVAAASAEILAAKASRAASAPKKVSRMKYKVVQLYTLIMVDESVCMMVASCTVHHVYTPLYMYHSALDFVQVSV